MASPSSLGARLRRRALTIPGLALALALFGALAPLTLALAGLADLLTPRRRAATLRLWATLGAYLLANVAGQLLLLGVWLGSGFGRARARRVRWTYAIQGGWVALLLRVMTRLWRLRWQVEGDADIEPAPIVLLVRHVSLLDTLIPSVFVSRAHGIPLRFVLKRELLLDPCLDIAGHFLPNHFVNRDLEGSRAELDAIAKLARELEPGEGLTIYPEGTRFSAAKRERILARLDARDPALAEQARTLEHTLLPRPSGTLALLRNAPAADVLTCAHVGLDGFMAWRDLWSGQLVGRTIELAFWRHAAASLPVDDEGRVRWLYARWAELDAWVGARR